MGVTGFNRRRRGLEATEAVLSPEEAAKIEDGLYARLMGMTKAELERYAGWSLDQRKSKEVLVQEILRLKAKAAPQDAPKEVIGG